MTFTILVYTHSINQIFINYQIFNNLNVKYQLLDIFFGMKFLVNRLKYIFSYQSFSLSILDLFLNFINQNYLHKSSDKKWF